MFRKKKGSTSHPPSSGPDSSKTTTSTSKTATSTSSKTATSVAASSPSSQQPPYPAIGKSSDVAGAEKTFPEVHVATRATPSFPGKEHATTVTAHPQETTVVSASATASSGSSPKVLDKAARKAKGARGFFKRAQTVVGLRADAAEARRLQEDKEKMENWKRWGPYLSERQWSTVREDYSADGAW